MTHENINFSCPNCLKVFHPSLFCTDCTLRQNFRKGNVVVAVSLYGNPLHNGHLQMFWSARKHGDYLLAIVNNDRQRRLKRSAPLLDESLRLQIIQNLKPVDQAVISIDDDLSVRQTLQLYRPDRFYNDGDVNRENCREKDICEKLGIELIFGNNKKINRSSNLISNIISWTFDSSP